MTHLVKPPDAAVSPTLGPTVLSSQSARPTWRTLSDQLKTQEVRALASERAYQRRAWSDVLRSLPVPKRVADAVALVGALAATVTEGKRSLETAPVWTGKDTTALALASLDLEDATASLKAYTKGKGVKADRLRAAVAVASLRQGLTPVGAAVTIAASLLTLRDIKAEREALAQEMDDALASLSPEALASLPLAFRPAPLALPELPTDATVASVVALLRAQRALDLEKEKAAKSAAKAAKLNLK